MSEVFIRSSITAEVFSISLQGSRHVTASHCSSDSCRGCLSCKCLLLQEEIMQLKCTRVLEFNTYYIQGCLLFFVSICVQKPVKYSTKVKNDREKVLGKG